MGSDPFMPRYTRDRKFTINSVARSNVQSITARMKTRLELASIVALLAHAAVGWAGVTSWDARLLKDIYPSSTGSSPGSLTNVNGTLFFSANDGTNGSELWKSDGTTSGTVIVKDIYPGGSGSSVSSLTNVNGTLFFSASGQNSGTELWQAVPIGDSTSVMYESSGIAYNTAFISNETNGTEAWIGGTTSQERQITLIFTDPTLADATLVSDRFSLTGTETDLIVLRLSYQSSAFADANAMLSWIDGAGNWVVATAGNTGSGALAGFHAMDYSNFLASNGGVLNSSMLGAYGRDAASDNVWAVINHNSTFAATAIPEPSAIALLGFALGITLWLRSRCGRSTAHTV